MKYIRNNMKSLRDYIIESLNESSSIQNLNTDDIKEIVTRFINTGKIISVKDNGKKFIVKLDDDNFDTEIDKISSYFSQNYNVDVDYDFETDSIEIHKKNFSKLSSLIKINNNQNNKTNYSDMSIDKLKKELIGKLLLKRDKLYGNGFDNGHKIINVTKRGSNAFIEYMDGTIRQELSVKMLDQNDSPYYEFQISKDKVSKAEQQAKEKEKHKVQSNGLTPHDEEIIDLAHSTTYRRDKNKYLKAVDTDKARKIIEYIFSDDETKWED